MAEKSKEVSVPSSWMPFAVAFPLLVIAFQGCLHDGCQGALNAQSAALHEAYSFGGWEK